jgi:hypothetical protein
LTDDPPVGPRGLEDERTKPIGSPTAHPVLDHGSDLFDGRDRLSVKPAHDLLVSEQLV